MDNNFRSGFVAIIGRPNVGKSTLMNHLIGQKIAITSNKPQTTRNKIQTVYTCDEGQIVFLDTPGIHKAKNKLGEYMVQVAERTLKEVDAIMWLVEPSTFVGAGERHIAEQLQKVGVPVILIINKIDTVKKEELLPAIDTYRKICDFAEIIPCSALRGKNTQDIIPRSDVQMRIFRTDYDLTQHQNVSGQDLTYFDDEKKQKYIPYVIEPSLGADRMVLAFLCSAYDEEVLFYLYEGCREERCPQSYSIISIRYLQLAVKMRRRCASAFQEA